MSTENNIYQSRYDEQSIIKTMKMNNTFKRKVRLNSQQERDYYNDVKSDNDIKRRNPIDRQSRTKPNTAFSKVDNLTIHQFASSPLSKQSFYKRLHKAIDKQKGKATMLSQYNTTITKFTNLNPDSKGKLSLSGRPLDPNLIANRELESKKEDRMSKDSKGYFNFISKKFAQAAKWHFSNNPTRKIKTSHLRVNSSNSSINEDFYSRILSEHIKKQSSELDPEELMNKSIDIDENNIYGFMNTLNLNSEVLSFNNEYQEPAKFVRVMDTLKNKKDKSFFKQVQDQFKYDNFIYSVKEKPTYKQATKDYSLMYCICKLCGLKTCKCKRDEILPFKKLKLDRAANRAQKTTIFKESGSDNKKLVIRASTIRALTSEPIHRRNVKMTRRGIPILKFSETNFNSKMDEGDDTKEFERDDYKYNTKSRFNITHYGRREVFSRRNKSSK